MNNRLHLSILGFLSGTLSVNAAILSAPSVASRPAVSAPSVASRPAVSAPSVASRPAAPATYYYSQSTGTLYGTQGVGPTVTQGYSGRGQGLNNPAAQGIRNTGPIPQGSYNATSVTTSKGPNTIVLQPSAGTDTLGRDNFRVHGDNKAMNNTASHGCIIVGPQQRQTISNQVTSGRPVQIQVGQ